MILIIAAMLLAFTACSKPPEDDSWKDKYLNDPEVTQAFGELIFYTVEPDTQDWICEMVLSGPDGYDTVVDALDANLARADAESVAAVAETDC